MKPILYLVMRNDLPSLNPGKLAAQAAHCANACVAAMKGSAILREWQRETPQSFGTTIVLGAGRTFIEGLPHRVWDTTYPCADGRVRNVLVGAFWLGRTKPYKFRRLRLYP